MTALSLSLQSVSLARSSAHSPKHSINNILHYLLFGSGFSYSGSVISINYTLNIGSSILAKLIRFWIQNIVTSISNEAAARTDRATTQTQFKLKD